MRSKEEPGNGGDQNIRTVVWAKKSAEEKKEKKGKRMMGVLHKIGIRHGGRCQTN